MTATAHRTSRSIRRPGLAILCLAAGLASPASRADCSLQVQPVTFGNYDFQSSRDLEGVGRITVTCDASTSYSITLGPGAGSYATRLMQNGSHQLAYNLYTDVIHSTVWGDGSGGSMSVSGSGTDADYPVYGLIPAGQNPYVGSYSDTITVLVSF
jgi:spore coat protein U-like protein